ncbi:MAG: outer membrane protein assembly factor BamA [Desulfomonilaceae bacterium]
MNKLLPILAILLVIPLVSSAEEAKIKKIMVFPFKAATKDVGEVFSNELASELGAELAREGDVEIVSGVTFAAIVQAKKVDPVRVARVAGRLDCYAALWGTVSKLEDGYSLEVWVVQTEQAQKAHRFSADGKDKQELVARMKDLAVEIGNVTLNRPKIHEIKVEGNKRVQKEAILNKLDLKPGSPFRKSAIGDDIREIYGMGYFDDVQIRADDVAQGEVDLHITLKERPSIKKIEIQGNKVFSRDELIDALTTKSFSVASVEKIRNDIAKIKKMYEKRGYYQPKIDYEIKELSPSEANLVFKIKEGQKAYLTDIVFEGRKSIPEKDLLKIMTVKEKGWFWFLDESGSFTREKLDENRMRLIAFYLDHGFINVQVGAPHVDIHDGSVKVVYPIREGDRYQIRKVKVEGDLVAPPDKMIEALKAKPKTWFKRSLVADDIKDLTKLYNNLGYAYADVEPLQRVNDRYKFVDLTYKIHKGQRVTIEKIDIVGNDRTRDKIIRRSLVISEGDLYSADRIEATKKRLEGMDFFEAVRLKTSPGSRPDLMNLTVEVMEKKTGSLSAGLGYSSQDGAMGNMEIKERNLFGMGIVTNGKANLSGRRNTYEGSITYPWIYDLPLSGTLRGYKSQSNEGNYLRNSDGFSVHLAYPVYGLWSMTTGLGHDSSKLSGMEHVFARSVVNYYRHYGTNAEKFSNISENAISVNFNRDTRNNTVIPTAGSRITLGSRYSGLGGDVTFASYFTEATYYHQLFWRAILKIRGNGTMLQEIGDNPIPFDRRLLLGGIQSIRGYHPGEIGPRDRYGSLIGGDRALYSNVECLFPLVDQLKLNGVVFVDAGNAWNSSESPLLTDVKAGAGVGIRWVSPMGPLRIEYGWKVNPLPGEERGAFAFAMGQLF